MPVVEVVWRHLLVSAREGRRGGPSVTALAGELGVAVSTTHRSLAHPIEVGAVEVGPIDGLQVLNRRGCSCCWPPTVTFSETSSGGLELRLPWPRWRPPGTSRRVVLGGFGAVIAHLGVNRIADYTRVLFYGDPKLPRLPAAEGRTGDRSVGSGA